LAANEEDRAGSDPHPVLIVGGGVTGLSSGFVVLAGVDGSGWMAAAASLDVCRWPPTASAWS
jgi:hypothetical protein